MNLVYVVNDEYANIFTHWIALYALNNNATYLTVLALNTFLK